YVTVMLMRDHNVSPILAAPAAVAIGAALGAVNGALVVRFRIHSFVVTLGTMLIWRGVLIALTGGFPMTVTIPPQFKSIMSAPLIYGFRMSMLWFWLARLDISSGHLPVSSSSRRSFSTPRSPAGWQARDRFAVFSVAARPPTRPLPRSSARIRRAPIDWRMRRSRFPHLRSRDD